MKKLYDVVVLRSLATVMVVAFHAYGMMYWQEGGFGSAEMADRYKDLYYDINQFVLNFRMPLFVFISGFLFSYLERERGKYPTFTGLLSNKFKRLIIPHIVFATIFMLSKGEGLNIKTIISGWYAHLWFITTLFWCFICTRLSTLTPYSNTRYYKTALLTLSFVILFFDLPKFGFLGVQYLPEWFFWFYLGYTVSPYRERLYNYLSKRKIWLFVFIAIYSLELIYTIRFTESEEERAGFVHFAHIAIVLLIWFVTNWIIRTSSKAWYENAIFKELNRTSYGIYVLHYWLQSLFIIHIAGKSLKIEELATNNVFIFPLLFFLISLVFSYIGAKFLLKTKAGRFLIG